MFLAWVTRKSRKQDQTRPAKRTPGTVLSAATNPTEYRLFLGGLGLGLLLRALLPDTNQAGVRPRLPERLVRTTLDARGQLALRDLGEGGSNGLLDAENVADMPCGLGGLLVLGGIGLLGLVGLARENNEALLVLLQALDVDREALLREVLAAGIHGDTDGAGIVLGNASSLFPGQKPYSTHQFTSSGAIFRPAEPKEVSPYLELSQREATAETCPAVVLDGSVNSLLDSSIPHSTKLHHDPRKTNGHRTIGRSLSTGRGASAAALARRARRRVTFLPGYFSMTRQKGGARSVCRAPFPSSFNEPGRSGTAHAAANACGSLKN